jgi:hypothetical protein
MRGEPLEGRMGAYLLCRAEWGCDKNPLQRHWAGRVMKSVSPRLQEATTAATQKRGRAGRTRKAVLSRRDNPLPLTPPEPDALRL